jgi:hypothetical protein
LEIGYSIGRKMMGNGPLKQTERSYLMETCFMLFILFHLIRWMRMEN